ncbi:adenylyl-sulfate kinase [Paenibacillus endoradicis]|uniref:adenylyl-sulfate kinase n=1 Tax=Paenibacillus endoradicis TaxID=2972487 RepID=UPI002159B087|nr:adenylyl-sulfate kinase [Paenibacillus endoradicis]MCR8658700.1 adenylyl-sulfate kinase [Paenibacillus endoradicis]
MQRQLIESMNAHRGGVIWFTGLPGSGKTTLAINVQYELLQSNIRCAIIDGDVIRHKLNCDLGFSEEDRMENLRRAAEVTRMFIEAGIFVLAPFITPSDTCRAMIRQHFQPEDYTELYVECSLAACIERDPKGMYALALADKLPNFTGISAPYDPPIAPDLTLDTQQLALQQCVDKLIEYIQNKVKINN